EDETVEELEADVRVGRELVRDDARGGLSERLLLGRDVGGVERVERLAERHLSKEDCVLARVRAKEDEAVVRRPRHLDAIEVKCRLLRLRRSRGPGTEQRRRPREERDER